MKTIRGKQHLLISIGDPAVRESFEQARRMLRPSPIPPPVATPTPSDWALLTRIHKLLEVAFISGDWQGAKREIEALKRRAQIHIVADNSDPR